MSKASRILFFLGAGMMILGFLVWIRSADSYQQPKKALDLTMAGIADIQAGKQDTPAISALREMVRTAPARRRAWTFSAGFWITLLGILLLGIAHLTIPKRAAYGVLTWVLGAGMLWLVIQLGWSDSTFPAGALACGIILVVAVYGAFSKETQQPIAKPSV